MITRTVLTSPTSDYVGTSPRLLDTATSGQSIPAEVLRRQVQLRVIDMQVVTIAEHVTTHFSSCEGVHDDMGQGSPLGGSIQDGGAMPVSASDELTDVPYTSHTNRVDCYSSIEFTSPQDGRDGDGPGSLGGAERSEDMTADEMR